MDYKQTASEILTKIGGKENLVSAAHCATRLRLVIADNAKCSKQALEDVDGVKGVFEASGQLQLIIGTGTVNKGYDEFIALAGVSAASKEEVKQAAASKANPFQRFIKTLGDIFVPIIPAIVASGFLMGIMESLNFLINNGYLNLSTENALFVLANMFSNTAYVFLPVLIGFSAAKVFGGNPFLGGVIGMIMVHPNLQNAWTMTGGVEQYLDVFGLWQVPYVGYQGHVISVMIAVFVMCVIEKALQFLLAVYPHISRFGKTKEQVVREKSGHRPKVQVHDIDRAMPLQHPSALLYESPRVLKMMKRAAYRDDVKALLPPRKRNAGTCLKVKIRIAQFRGVNHVLGHVYSACLDGR